MNGGAVQKTYRDLQLEFYRGGVDAVLSLVDARRVSPFTVKRAIRELRSDGADVGDLEFEIAERGIVVGPASSSRAPGPGDVRRYKVQRAKGQKFIRLNVDALDVEVGDVVSAHFFVGQVKVEAVEVEA